MSTSIHQAMMEHVTSSREGRKPPNQSQGRKLRRSNSNKSLSSGKALTESSPDDDEDVVVIKTTEEKLKQAERIIASKVFYTNNVPMSLANFSICAFFFQMLQSLILFLVATKPDVKWYWYVSYPNPDLTEDDTLRPQLKEIGSISVLWLVPVVTLLSGFEHLSCVLFRESYEYYIARHQNPFRWTEYTFSASLMKVLIAMQVGITDFQLLVCIFVLMAIAVQCAATHEAVNAKARSEDRKQNWRPFFTAWIGHLSCWAIIWNYFIVYNRRGGNERGALWALVLFQFLLDTSFAILFTLQWNKIGAFEDYVKGEKGFIVLSFTSKTLLVWLSVINAMGME